MSRLFQNTFLLLVALALTGCVISTSGSGKVITETREVSDFNQVELTTIGRLIITQTGSESLTVEGEENLLKNITTEVRGDRLVIGNRSKIYIKTTRPVVYRLNVKNLERIVLSGSGSVEAGNITSDRLVADLSGSGEMNLGKVSVQSFKFNGSGSGSFESRGIDSKDASLEANGSGSSTIENLAADVLTVVQSSSGSITIDGRIGDQEVEISGSGSYEAEELDSRRALVTVSGSGGADITVRDELNAKISGSGSISYSGDPEVMRNVSGSGRIRKR